MTNQVLYANTAHFNISPEAFHLWAQHYFKCKQDFHPPSRFSPVPYFLLCRCIELEIKSRHLESKKRSEVKEEFGHNLLKAYESLSIEHKVLSDDELSVLSAANEIYRGKGFEYFNPEHAMKGFSNFPSLDALDAIAEKLVERKCC